MSRREALPPPPEARAEGSKKKVVYLPSCVTRMMGPARGDAGAPDGGVAPVEDGGCAITGGRRAPWPGLWLLLAGLVARLGYAWRRCGS